MLVLRREIVPTITVRTQRTHRPPDGVHANDVGPGVPVTGTPPPRRQTRARLSPYRPRVRARQGIDGRLRRHPGEHRGHRRERGRVRGAVRGQRE